MAFSNSLNISYAQNSLVRCNSNINGFESINNLKFDSSSDSMQLISTLSDPYFLISTSVSGSSNSSSFNLSRGDTTNGKAEYNLLTGSTLNWRMGLTPIASGLPTLCFTPGLTNTVMTLAQSGYLSLFSISSGITSPPALNTQFNLGSFQQGAIKLAFTGLNFINGTTSNEGIGFALGRNNTNNKELWIGDTSLFSSPSHPLIRISANGIGNPLLIDTIGADGSANYNLSLQPSTTQKLLIGATNTTSGKLNVVDSGSSTQVGSTAYFGSGTTVTAGNIYGLKIDKFGVDSILIGINKNTVTGSIGINLPFISTYTPNGLIIGRGDGTGLPSSADLIINNQGDITIPNNLTLSGFNKALKIKSINVSGGTANAYYVGNVILSGGSATVNNSLIDSTWRGIPICKTEGGTIGAWRVVTTTGSFTVKSTNVLDTSTLDVWFILPA